ncbi:META domain-containing protein [Acinetobacter piscicola]|uniref:META domain-containing protein n=1 Tax=Acinetobacter piscicola TaxID=2006115 RepID=UPI0010221C39|nr:META domain-containing protein [Acinetobacter piscicola]RYL25205.1 META domain-containing protein [Acinetobacter piscicola]
MMKIVPLLFFCALLSVSACQNSPTQNQSLNLTAPLSTQQFTDALTQYTWGYTPPNSSVPILVNISTQGTQIYSGCNQISKMHVLNGKHLKANPVQVQTLMGCGALEYQEQLATQIFTDAHLDIQTHAKDQKKLNVSLKNGAIYTFQALPSISDLPHYDAELLKKFTWQHQTDEPSLDQIQPLLINFTADHMLFYAGCNRQSQNYILENKTIIPKGNLRSQVKFCGNRQHERQIAQSMSKPMSIRFDFSTALPKLILESKYQPTMIFQAIKNKT